MTVNKWEDRKSNVLSLGERILENSFRELRESELF